MKTNVCSCCFVASISFPSGPETKKTKKRRKKKRWEEKISWGNEAERSASLNSGQEVHCDKANLTWLGDKRRKREREKKNGRTDGQSEKEMKIWWRKKKESHRRRIEEELNRNEQVTHTMIRHNDSHSLRPIRSWYIQFTELLTIIILKKGRQKEKEMEKMELVDSWKQPNLFKRSVFLVNQ
jgi:hypothetical protein